MQYWEVLCASFVVGSSTGKYFWQVFGQEGLCASPVVLQDEFCTQGTKMAKERDVRMKDGLKKNEMSRQKVSKETSLTERGLKIKCETTGNKKNGAKRKPCQENEMWREENVKRRRSQKKQMPKAKQLRMPRERDVNGKRLKRHRFEETAMTSEKACQERRVCQVSGFKKCQEQAASDRCREQEMSRTKASKRSRSRRPCQPGSQALFL